MTILTPIEETVSLARFYSDQMAEYLMGVDESYPDDILMDMTDFEAAILDYEDDSIENYFKARLRFEADPFSFEDYAAEVAAATGIFQVAKAAHWLSMSNPVPTRQMLDEIEKLEGWTVERELCIEQSYHPDHEPHIFTYFVVTDPHGDYGLITLGSCHFTDIL